MSDGRKRKQTQERGTRRQQVQARARHQTETVRAGLEELSLPDGGEGQAGELPRRARQAPSRRRPGLLTRLLGSRPAVVHLQVAVRPDGGIDVLPCVVPRSAEAKTALNELAALVAHIFEQGRAQLTEAQWARLLGEVRASVGERLILLTRLAIAPATKIQAPRLAFTPRDRGLKLYHAKFAALPDGLPFSLRLLLSDARGRPPEEDGDGLFLQLPEPVLLLALRRTLALERRQAQSWSDYEVGKQIRTVLEGMGIALPTAPTDEAMRTLRERWGKEVFPNRTARKRAAASEKPPT
jgi:hypothetical protein